MSDSRRYTRSHTDGCTRRPKRDVQRYDSNSSRNSEIIRERPHRATAGVRKFADVHGSRDVGVSVAEKEGDFVDALAGQECSTGNRVPEAVHRWQRTVGNKDRMSILIDVAQDRECRVALRVDCSLLSVPECSADVPLLQRSAGPGREHIVIRPYEPSARIRPSWSAGGSRGGRPAMRTRSLRHRDQRSGRPSRSVLVTQKRELQSAPRP